MRWFSLFAVLLLSFPAFSEMLPPSKRGAALPHCPFGTALPDGCTGAQSSGLIPYPSLADVKKVTMVSLVGGRGYTDGFGYVWTSFGGGCRTNASGTVDVVGGELINGLVTNEGSGCTSRPTISLPKGVGAGAGGRIVPTVYQLTPHNTSPTYNVPGVDYPVGYSTAIELKDPTSYGALPACASLSGAMVTINTNACTLDGYDFTLHQNNLTVAPNLRGTFIANNKFAANSNNTNAILSIGSGSCDVTIKYNQFDGRAARISGSGFRLISNLNSRCYSGQITFEYNYCFDFDSKCLNFGGAHGDTPETLKITEQYNVYAEIGLCARNCSHGEAQYSYSGYTSGTVHETLSPWIMKFNVALTHFANAGGSATSAVAIEADAVNITDADVEYNLVLNPGPWSATGSDNSANSPVTASAPIYCGQQENGSNSRGIMAHNLIDYTGAYFPYNASGRTCAIAFPSISDLNAVTGGSCNMARCN